MEDPLVSRDIQERVKAALRRHNRRERARQKALVESWFSGLGSHEHEPTTVMAHAGESARGTVLDDIAETRCTSCGQLMGFAV